MISWARHLKISLIAFGALLVFAYGFVVLMNPYGSLPVRLFGAHVIMDINQRYQYPAIARSGAFDSAVIGTSTSRLLDPDRLSAKLGGHFANMAMNDARAWEQYRLAKLFLEHQPNARLLVALDHVWCNPHADTDRISRRGFPEWMFDANPWNDFIYHLNPRTLEFAGRLALHRAGLKSPRIPANGYEIFVPPEREYDAEKALRNVWGGRPREIRPVSPAYVATADDLRAWTFPALAWLDELLETATKDKTHILAFMPTHLVVHPIPGSIEAARDATCRERVKDIATRHGVVLIDFRIPSAITSIDTNYWDPLHYRLPIADRIVDDIVQAVETSADAPNGDWTFLSSHRTAK